jgi:phosphoserine phosphatase RsbU/P
LWTRIDGTPPRRRLMSSSPRSTAPMISLHLMHGSTGSTHRGSLWWCAPTIPEVLPTTDPAVLAVDVKDGELVFHATLRGVLHRSSVVREVQNELCLIERFHGGLETQLTQMHDELQLAAMVQREFIPSKLPALHGIDFGVLWRPANYVSGDIYDVTRLDDDHLGVFIADAVGHGVPAALMTMVIARSLVLAEDRDGDRQILPPGEVVSRLNNRLIDRREGSTRFATGAYALIDCRSRTLRVAGAGHPPPLHCKPNGTITPLETEGGLLGIFRDETYSEVEIELELHDHVLFYSDGFEVAFPNAAADSYEQRKPTMRYIEEFADMFVQGSPTRMIQHIQQRIDSQCGSLHQVDDLTLLCLHAGPIGVPPEIKHNSTAPVPVAA